MARAVDVFGSDQPSGQPPVDLKAFLCNCRLHSAI
jgi:hypothetical protein